MNLAFQYARRGALAAGIAGLAAASFSFSTPLLAATAFDGDWEVSIIVESGTCDQGFQISIHVIDGTVSYAGQINSTATGAVTNRGAVNIRFAHDKDVVDGVGTLAAQFGEGKWTSATLKCTGTWIARRN